MKNSKSQPAKYDGRKVVSWAMCHWQPGKSPAEAIRQADLVDRLAAVIREHAHEIRLLEPRP